MLKEFYFLVTLVLLIDVNESIPYALKAPREISQHDAVEAQEQINTSIKDGVEEFSKQQNESDSIDKEIHTEEYPVLTKHEPQHAEDKSETDTLETLKIKCQHLQNLLKANKTTDNLSRPSRPHYPNVHLRPVYITPKPTVTPFNPSTPKPIGFYITAQTPTNRNPTVNIQTSPPIKFIRLEPVILQKTILNDGRTIYYWHRSLPTAVEYPSDYSAKSQPNDNNLVNQRHENVENDYEQQPYRGGYGYAPQSPYLYPSPNLNQASSSSYYYPVSDRNSNVADKKPMEQATETTTSTTEESYGYGLSNFIPFYSFTGGDSTTSTPQPTTTPPAKPLTDNGMTDDLLYAQQLKFVVPVPYGGSYGNMHVRQPPWSFDQYAYYPTELQSNTPYNPTFQMIRAVAIPKTAGDASDRIDKVDINESE